MPLNLSPQQRAAFDQIFEHPTPENLRAISIQDFTTFIAYLFEREGKYEPVIIDGAHDHGIDIQLRVPFGNPPVIIGGVQCKRFLFDQIRVGAIREFQGALTGANLHNGFFFTTNHFTKPARALAQTSPVIYPYDNEEIAKWIHLMRMNQQGGRMLHSVSSLPVPVIVVANHKGGVGKTAITSCLAAGLADLKLNVLAIDMDPQGNLTRWLMPREVSKLPASQTIKEVFDQQHPLAPLIVRNTTVERVAIIPAHDSLALNLPHDIERRLAEQLALLPFEELGIDIVVIDTQPALSSLTRAAIIASRYVLVPFRLDQPSLEGIQQFFPFLRDTEVSHILRPLEIIGGVAIAVEATKVQNEMLPLIRAAALENDRVNATPLRESDFWVGTLRKRVDYSTAEHEQRSVFAVDPKSEAVKDVRRMTVEVLKHVNALARVAN